MSFVNFIRLFLAQHKQEVRITTEFFNSYVPFMNLLTIEDFSRAIPTMQQVTVERFDNTPPVMEEVSTERFDGFTLNRNLSVATTPTQVASFAPEDAVVVEQEVDAGVWKEVYRGRFGAIGSMYFYPQRQHRVSVPNNINDGCSRTVNPPNPFTFTPQYTSDTVITFSYPKDDPLCPFS